MCPPKPPWLPVSPVAPLRPPLCPQGPQTHEGDAGRQQQDPHQQVLKLLHHQLPDGLAWPGQRSGVKSQGSRVSSQPLPRGGGGRKEGDGGGTHLPPPAALWAPTRTRVLGGEKAGECGLRPLAHLSVCHCPGPTGRPSLPPHFSLCLSSCLLGPSISPSTHSSACLSTLIPLPVRPSGHHSPPPRSTPAVHPSPSCLCAGLTHLSCTPPHPLSLHLSVYPSILVHPFCTHPSVHVSVRPSIHLRPHPCTYRSCPRPPRRLSVCSTPDLPPPATNSTRPLRPLLVHLSVPLSVLAPAMPSTRLTATSIHPPACPSVYTSIHTRRIHLAGLGLSAPHMQPLHL